MGVWEWGGGYISMGERLWIACDGGNSSRVDAFGMRGGGGYISKGNVFGMRAAGGNICGHSRWVKLHV